MTDRGWGVLGAGAASIALWVLLGEGELLAAGSVLTAGSILAYWFTALGRPTLAIIRQLIPALVHEGDTAEVRVRITNIGRRTAFNLSISDQVGPLGAADFEVARLKRGQTITATYRIICRPRGVYPVGPATVQISDPARLATKTVTVPGEDRLVVYPATESLVGFPIARGKDPTMQAARPEFSNRGGEDFFTLREYVDGDDLRFIHWRSSAKRDQLLIRQMETPWQQRALILLDLRRDAYQNAPCFEHAVRATASLVVHFANAGYDSLVWAGGVDPVPTTHNVTVMEQLAMAKARDRLDLRLVASRFRQKGGGGALVVVTGTPDPEVADVIRLLGQDYGISIALCATETASPVLAAMHRSGVPTIERRPGEPWADGWTQALGSQWADSPAR